MKPKTENEDCSTFPSRWDSVESTEANKAAGAGCISRLVRRSSFCYEVRERGISALRVAWMIAEDWKHRKMEGPIPIIKSGAGLWVIKHLESIGIAVEGVQVKAGQVHVRVVTELAYHVVDVSDHPENENTPAEGTSSAQTERESVLRDAACSDLVGLSFDGIIRLHCGENRGEYEISRGDDDNGYRKWESISLPETIDNLVMLDDLKSIGIDNINAAAFRRGKTLKSFNLGIGI